MILAIDPSLTGTGICFADQTTTVIRCKLTGPERLVFIREAIRLAIHNKSATGIIIEDYSYGSKNGAHQIGELGGILRVLFFELGLPVAFVAPTLLKKYMTGKGTAKKCEVVSQATDRAKRCFNTDDEADAWGLGAIAAQHTGAPWAKMPADRQAAVDKVAWPANWPEAIP